MLDWRHFLASHGIAYQDAGKHEIVCGCPYCGALDAAQHYLAVSTRGRGWRCFRNVSHRGRSNVRLVAALLRCTEDHARELLGEQIVPLPSADYFSEQWRQQLGLTDASANRPESITLPREFKPMSSKSRFADAFWEYLYDRGYTQEQAAWAVQNYDLYYSIHGKFSYRIVIPVHDARGKLMTWTGRSILPAAEIRYKTLAADDSCAAPGALLLGLPMLWKVANPKCLVVAEGPFDGIAISALGHRYGIYGTCLFGVQVSEQQAELLVELERRFERMRLLVDPDARLRVLSFRDRLPKRCKPSDMMPGLKDPGELIRAEAAIDFLRAL